MLSARLAAVSALVALLGSTWPAAAPVPPVIPLRVPADVLKLVGRANRVDPPLRLRNWVGRRGQGSCMHASLWHLLQFQGRPQLAAWWRERYGDGEFTDSLGAKLDAAGVDWSSTDSGDEEFLEWACRTRRGAIVSIDPAHAVDLVGLDRERAFVLDPNAPQQIKGYGRSDFLQRWRAQGGWALTPLAGHPLPPAPWTVTRPQPKEKR